MTNHTYTAPTPADHLDTWPTRPRLNRTNVRFNGDTLMVKASVRRARRSLEADLLVPRSRSARTARPVRPSLAVDVVERRATVRAIVIVALEEVESDIRAGAR
ncbi:hypothetical protein IEE94_11430 [Yimella sp. cx-573]|nr:hypothetical protein [Yimella sp. cx-573]